MTAHIRWLDGNGDLGAVVFNYKLAVRFQNGAMAETPAGSGTLDQAAAAAAAIFQNAASAVGKVCNEQAGSPPNMAKYTACAKANTPERVCVVSGDLVLGCYTASGWKALVPANWSPSRRSTPPVFFPLFNESGPFFHVRGERPHWHIAGVRWLGEVSAADLLLARGILIAWAKGAGKSSVSPVDYGGTPELNPSWAFRDGQALRTFRTWWNGSSANTPKASQNTGTGTDVTYPTDQDMAALKAWSAKNVPQPPAGWVPPPVGGAPTVSAASLACASGCESQYGLTSGNLDAVGLQQCLLACAAGGGGGPGGGGGGAPPACPAGTVWDETNKACQPAPSGTSAQPSSSSGVSSTTGLLVIGAVVLAAVGIFAAVVGGGAGAAAGAAMRQNARRGKTKLDQLREELPPGYTVETYSPGDGVTRYRFFLNAPSKQSYFGPDNGIYTALGYKEAYTFAMGLQRDSSAAANPEEWRGWYVQCRGQKLTYREGFATKQEAEAWAGKNCEGFYEVGRYR